MLFDSPALRRKARFSPFLFLSECEEESELEQVTEQKRLERMASPLDWKEPVAAAQVKFQLYDIMGFF